MLEGRKTRQPQIFDYDVRQTKMWSAKLQAVHTATGSRRSSSYRVLGQWRIRFENINLFISGLFNNAVSSSECITSEDKMINGKWMGNDAERSGRGLV
jgi:hypothetical protein